MSSKASRKTSPLLLLFPNYNLGFHLKTLISKSPRDENLTLVFKMLQEALGNLSNSKTKEIKYQRGSKIERKTSSLLLVMLDFGSSEVLQHC
jgi:hypothetical protein